MRRMRSKKRSSKRCHSPKEEEDQLKMKMKETRVQGLAHKLLILQQEKGQGREGKELLPHKLRKQAMMI